MSCKEAASPWRRTDNQPIASKLKPTPVTRAKQGAYCGALDYAQLFESL